ncbi:MAG: PAS domain-containing protein, partial [Desulfomonilaceae bacterium]
MTDQTLDQVIVRSLQEGVLTIECNGVISGANPAALRILGSTYEEVEGHTADCLGLDTVANSAFLEVFHSLVTDGVITPHMEVELTPHDGRKIQLSISSAALDIAECVPGMESYVVLFRDITAFKNLEIAKRKAADHLSHELKTPLAILKASLERLLELTESNPKASKLIKRAERNL